MTNILYVNHDPDYWEAPNQWRPERFLSSDADLLPSFHESRRRLITNRTLTKIFVCTNLLYLFPKRDQVTVVVLFTNVACFNAACKLEALFPT